MSTSTASLSPAFSLRVSDLHWLTLDFFEEDLCAHGTVELRVGERVEKVDGLSVGPACVLLLRALDQDHDSDSTGNHLVPHCGHAFFVDEAGVWLNVNCDSGLDWGVRHAEAQALVTLFTETSSVTIRREQWVAAVVCFCDTVEDFYRKAAPKLPTDETAEGYRAFWREWQDRRAAVG